MELCHKFLLLVRYALLELLVEQFYIRCDFSNPLFVHKLLLLNLLESFPHFANLQKGFIELRLSKFGLVVEGVDVSKEVIAFLAYVWD